MIARINIRAKLENNFKTNKKSEKPTCLERANSRLKKNINDYRAKNPESDVYNFSIFEADQDRVFRTFLKNCAVW